MKIFRKFTGKYFFYVKHGCVVYVMHMYIPVGGCHAHYTTGGVGSESQVLPLNLEYPQQVRSKFKSIHTLLHTSSVL